VLLQGLACTRRHQRTDRVGWLPQRVESRCVPPTSTPTTTLFSDHYTSSLQDGSIQAVNIELIFPFIQLTVICLPRTSIHEDQAAYMSSSGLPDADASRPRSGILTPTSEGSSHRHRHAADIPSPQPTKDTGSRNGAMDQLLKAPIAVKVRKLVSTWMGYIAWLTLGTATSPRSPCQATHPPSDHASPERPVRTRSHRSRQPLRRTST
jgi:hypothetical protein